MLPSRGPWPAKIWQPPLAPEGYDQAEPPENRQHQWQRRGPLFQPRSGGDLKGKLSAGSFAESPVCFQRTGPILGGRRTIGAAARTAPSGIVCRLRREDPEPRLEVSAMGERVGGSAMLIDL